MNRAQETSEVAVEIVAAIAVADRDFNPGNSDWDDLIVSLTKMQGLLFEARANAHRIAPSEVRNVLVQFAAMLAVGARDFCTSERLATPCVMADALHAAIVRAETEHRETMQ